MLPPRRIRRTEEVKARIVRVETDVQEVKADVRVILTKMEERQKHENRKLLIALISGKRGYSIRDKQRR